MTDQHPSRLAVWVSCNGDPHTRILDEKLAPYAIVLTKVKQSADALRVLDDSERRGTVLAGLIVEWKGFSEELALKAKAITPSCRRLLFDRLDASALGEISQMWLNGFIDKAVDSSGPEPAEELAHEIIDQITAVDRMNMVALLRRRVQQFGGGDQAIVSLGAGRSVTPNEIISNIERWTDKGQRYYQDLWESLWAKTYSLPDYNHFP